MEKRFLKEWLKHGIEKFEVGVPLAVDLKFFIKPPSSISRVKNNQNILKSEVLRVVKKPDADNLGKSPLDADAVKRNAKNLGTTAKRGKLITKHL